jgi:tetratricopeptide (TPR) repeat protein
MRQAVQGILPAKQKEEEQAKLIEETKQRMEMFEQVLEIDNDDLLANYGLGSCYVALKEFAKAIPLLEKAIAIKPSYTVAYLSLAEAQASSGDNEAAARTYESGIEVAAKRGDMTPLAEMQRRLAALKAGKPL